MGTSKNWSHWSQTYALEEKVLKIKEILAQLLRGRISPRHFREYLYAINDTKLATRAFSFRLRYAEQIRETWIRHRLGYQWLPKHRRDYCH